MPFIDMQRKRYFYEAQLPADRDPKHIIVFIHGAGGNHMHWAYQLESLGNEHLAIAVDLPGHGQSQGNSANTTSEYVDFLYTFSEHLIGSPFILAGHSMGGAIAQEFAHSFPAKLSGLVLAGTGARLKVLPAIIKTFAEGNVFRELVNYLYGKNPPKHLLDITRKDMETVSPKVFFNDFTACNNFNMMDKLAEIETKTLIVSAGEDSLTPVKYGEYLANQIPNSEMHMIKQAGHMMMMEQSQQFNKLVSNFLAGI